MGIMDKIMFWRKEPKFDLGPEPDFDMTGFDDKSLEAGLPKKYDTGIPSMPQPAIPQAPSMPQQPQSGSEMMGSFSSQVPFQKQQPNQMEPTRRISQLGTRSPRGSIRRTRCDL